MLLYKNIQSAVSDIDSQKRKVCGYLSAFGNVDRDGDMMMRGAFAKTIQERKEMLYFLNQHNWKMPLAKFQLIQEDEKGLYFETQAIPDTTYGNDVIKLYEAGILNQHSIGYEVMGSRYDVDSKVNYLTEVKLYEGSCVTMGANPETPFVGMKGCLTTIEDKTKKIVKAFRSGTFTDDTYVLLEVALKQLQKQAYELGKQKSLQEPDAGTIPSKPTIASAQIIKNYLTQI